MQNKTKKMIITIIILIISIIIVVTISKSDFSNLKKYDKKDSFDGTSSFKNKMSSNRYYSKEVTILSDTEANLGDFTVNIANNKKLISNISIKLKKNKNSDWFSDNSLEEEIIKKGVILRHTVIKNLTGKNINTNSKRIKKILKKKLNARITDGSIEEVIILLFSNYT